jgi:hypothetical protein
MQKRLSRQFVELGLQIRLSLFGTAYRVATMSYLAIDVYELSFVQKITRTNNHRVPVTFTAHWTLVKIMNVFKVLFQSL